MLVEKSESGINSTVELQETNPKRRSRKRIGFLFFFLCITSLVSDSTFSLKNPLEPPPLRVSSLEANFQYKNCIIEIYYPKLDSIQGNVSEIILSRINKTLKKEFFSKRLSNPEVGCNSDYKQTDPTYYSKITFEVMLNEKKTFSLVMTLTGYLAGAPTPYILKKGYNFDLRSGYSIFLSDIFRKESGYKSYLDSYITAELLERGILLTPQGFSDYKNKIEFCLNPKELQLILQKKGTQPVSVFIPYENLFKYMNQDLFDRETE